MFFDHEARGILAPRPGIEAAPRAWEDEVLTAGPPGKSQGSFSLAEFLTERVITWLLPQFLKLDFCFGCYSTFLLWSTF